MLFRDTINLISTTKSVNAIGNAIDIETSQTVYANKKSIRQTEFYQAMATGLKPELMFEIREIDYNNERLLDYNNKRYDIIRTYSKNGEILEIVCGAIVGTEVR